ncbi:MAG: hypothetical protein IT375_01940 [Polyangiaceae bacterium]|nr:hypothetical protein [Polyangiaceae bacterium]
MSDSAPTTPSPYDLPPAAPPVERFVVVSLAARNGACFVSVRGRRLGIVGSRSNLPDAIGLARDARDGAHVINRDTLGIEWQPSLHEVLG